MSAASFNVHAALIARYCAPEWALLFEVGNATGHATNRHADAIAMSLWPSRGLDLHGIEVKISRSDWLREKKDPAKAEGIGQFCDFWWLAVSDAAIVKPGELPTSWGLLAPRGDKLTCVKEATLNEHKKPLTRGFLAAIFRCIHAQASLPEKEIKTKAFEEGYQRGKESNISTRETWKRPYDELVRAVEEFQAKSGVRISTYNGPHIGKQFNQCFQSSKDHEKDLWNLLKTANSIRDQIAYAMKNAASDPICDYMI